MHCGFSTHVRACEVPVHVISFLFGVLKRRWSVVRAVVSIRVTKTSVEH